MAIQQHLSDAYECQWNWDRWNYYDGYYIPRVQVDGLYGLVGWDEANYDSLEEDMNERLLVPTDVTIELYGEVLRDQAYKVTVVLGVEDGGEAKTVRLHLFNVLWDYPAATDGRYNNCVREGWELGDFGLTPGGTVTVEHTFNFDNVSWNRQEDIRIGAYVHDPVTPPPYSAEVFQAEMVAWPLDPPGCKGDVNADEWVDIDDIFDVLAHWGEGAGQYDVNNDGMVDIDDVFDILYNWGPC
ncbi:MAG: hypothetical protein JSV91_02620 [Phycisphaerales bacterium]|nr:MAG: hypothetical protein JSV91_02620 [Phycisphaerales bacterium]